MNLLRQNTGAGLLAFFNAVALIIVFAVALTILDITGVVSIKYLQQPRIFAPFLILCVIASLTVMRKYLKQSGDTIIKKISVLTIFITSLVVIPPYASVVIKMMFGLFYYALMIFYMLLKNLI